MHSRRVAASQVQLLELPLLPLCLPRPLCKLLPVLLWPAGAPPLTLLLLPVEAPPRLAAGLVLGGGRGAVHASQAAAVGELTSVHMVHIGLPCSSAAAAATSGDTRRPAVAPEPPTTCQPPCTEDLIARHRNVKVPVPTAVHACDNACLHRQVQDAHRYLATSSYKVTKGMGTLSANPELPNTSVILHAPSESAGRSRGSEIE